MTSRTFPRPLEEVGSDIVMSASTTELSVVDGAPPEEESELELSEISMTVPEAK